MTCESKGSFGAEIGRRLGLFAAVLAISAFGLGLTAVGALALSPSVATKAASNVDFSTATLNGSVNPNGL